jgi:hypothetical protein
MKECRNCHEIKQFNEFYCKDNKTGRLSSKCKFCEIACEEERRQKPESKIKKRDYCRLQYQQNATYRKKANDNQKKYYRNLKLSVIKKYGAECNCCKESNSEFLSIDHINGNGSKELLSIGLRKFLLNLRNNEISKDYRVLCRNCNQSLGYYGYCPHNYKPIIENYTTTWQKRYTALRTAVLDLYGHKCQCCNESNYEFLAIDHVKGNGSEERKLLTPERFLSKLIKIGQRHIDYRLLCHNCNSSMWYSGFCPHKINVMNKEKSPND